MRGRVPAVLGGAGSEPRWGSRAASVVGVSCLPRSLFKPRSSTDPMHITGSCAQTASEH